MGVQVSAKMTPLSSNGVSLRVQLCLACCSGRHPELHNPPLHIDADEKERLRFAVHTSEGLGHALLALLALKHSMKLSPSETFRELTHFCNLCTPDFHHAHDLNPEVSDPSILGRNWILVESHQMTSMPGKSSLHK